MSESITIAGLCLDDDCGIRVVGDPQSIINLIGRFLSEAVRLKKSGQSYLIWCVEWIF